MGDGAQQMLVELVEAVLWEQVDARVGHVFMQGFVGHVVHVVGHLVVHVPHGELQVLHFVSDILVVPSISFSSEFSTALSGMLVETSLLASSASV